MESLTHRIEGYKLGPAEVTPNLSEDDIPRHEKEIEKIMVHFYEENPQTAEITEKLKRRLRQKL